MSESSYTLHLFFMLRCFSSSSLVRYIFASHVYSNYKLYGTAQGERDHDDVLHVVREAVVAKTVWHSPQLINSAANE